NWTLFDKTLKYCTQHSPYPPLLFSLRSHGIIIRLFVTLTGLDCAIAFTNGNHNKQIHRSK
ncbi:hypothetical protein, partial [Nostoc sp. CHAB 5715]|uniref:hypothetical protein n=1 Tax=Nostoc sp. CHAB 5715 TaxID=2780400 RepID=UPI001E6332EB